MSGLLSRYSDYATGLMIEESWLDFRQRADRYWGLPSQLLLRWARGAHFLGFKRQHLEDDHSPSYSAGVDGIMPPLPFPFSWRGA
jgi:hypothetical protein